MPHATPIHRPAGLLAAHETLRIGVIEDFGRVSQSVKGTFENARHRTPPGQDRAHPEGGP